MSGLHRASKIISAVWFLALITAIPYAVCTEVVTQKHPITEKVINNLFYYFYNTMIIIWNSDNNKKTIPIICSLSF